MPGTSCCDVHGRGRRGAPIFLQDVLSGIAAGACRIPYRDGDCPGTATQALDFAPRHLAAMVLLQQSHQQDEFTDTLAKIPASSHKSLLELQHAVLALDASQLVCVELGGCCCGCRHSRSPSVLIGKRDWTHTSVCL